MIHVMTGRSGAGKSAFLIRPLRWLVQNKPMGEGFRRWGSDRTSVTIWLDDGNGGGDIGATSWIARMKVENFQCHEDADVTFIRDMTEERWRGCTIITRFRTDKENGYTVNRQDSAGPIVHKIGPDRRVPEPVAELLRMGEINFQFQHDPIYMLAMNRNPFDLARTMNELAGMGKIDEVVGRINRAYDENKKLVGVVEKRLAEADAEAEKYLGLGDMDVAVSVAEMMGKEVEESRDRAAGIHGTLSSIEKAQQEIGRYDGLEKVLDSWSNMDVASASAAGKRETAMGIAALVSRIRSLVGMAGKYEGIGELEKALPEIPDTAGLREKAEEVLRPANHIMVLGERERKVATELDGAKGEFARDMPPICPLCGASGMGAVEKKTGKAKGGARKS